MFGRSKIKPAIVKIKGKAEDVAFLDYCIRQLMSGCALRKTGSWLTGGKQTFVDDNGCNELELVNGNDFAVINKMAEQLGVKVISLAYGSIPKDDRPSNKATMTYSVMYNGRSVVFDLSTK